MQILRDLSVLHIQLGNYQAFNDDCSKLLENRPQLKVNWLGYAISLHLIGKPNLAEKVLIANQELDAQQISGNIADYEQSELLLYINLLIEESGDFQRAVDHLEKYKDSVKDITGWKEAKGSF